MPPPAERRSLWAAVGGLLVAAPFLLVRVPPLTDLPQHVAQVRLFLDALANPASPYLVQWLTPYSLVYALIGGAWLLAGPWAAGPVTMLAIGVLSVAALTGLAARRGRPAASALLASALYFSHVTYWGFASFALGWPLFLLWLGLTTGLAARRRDGRALTALAATAIGLYLTHALWFAVAALWLLLHGVASRVPLGAFLPRLATLAPAGLAALAWFPRLEARGFTSPAAWQVAPLARLSPEWLVTSALGGLMGPTERVLLGAVAAWVLVGLWQRRRPGSGGVDRELLLAATLLVLLSLALPDDYRNTIRFAERWLPFGVALALLALPAPAVRPLLRGVLAAGLVGVLCLATATAWVAFERTRLAGLGEALDALPPGQRVLGLAFFEFDPLFVHRPYVNTFAYAQVLRGGELNRSFADLAPNLVVYRTPRPAPWTPRLHWEAWRVQPGDFRHFDYALVGGRSDVHRRMAETFGLLPVSAEGVWRLYRIPRPPP